MSEIESLAHREDWFEHRRRHEYDRLLMLSDGVFAIAITLAAIEIRLPEGLGSLSDVLARAGTQVGSYIVSFLVIAVFWIGHRDLFACLKRVDARLSALTLALLCGIALIPVSTHTLYASGPVGGGFRFYALTMTVCGALSTAMWLYPGLVPNLVIKGVPPRYRLMRAISSAIVPALFLVLLVCSPQVALAIVPPLGVALVIVRRMVLPRLMKAEPAG